MCREEGRRNVISKWDAYKALFVCLILLSTLRYQRQMYEDGRSYKGRDRWSVG